MPRTRRPGVAWSSGPTHGPPPLGIRLHGRRDAGRHQDDGGREGAYDSEVGGGERGPPAWAGNPQAAPAHPGGRNARLAAPPESAIQLAVDMVAVCEGEGAHLALRDDLEVDVMIGAQGL
jgi:hypothetical protein